MKKFLLLTTALCAIVANAITPHQITDTSANNVNGGDISIRSDYVALIDPSYFPDANFRSYLLEKFPNGYITSDDVNSTTVIDVMGKNISNLLGIQYFTALITLACENNNLTSLPDLSALTQLERLRCNHNRLTSLPYLPSSLEYLYLNDNRFTEFYMNGRTNLSMLSLDDCPNLKTVSVNNNSSLFYLSLHNCSALTTLYCYSNNLSALGLSGCTKLEYLNCEHNSLNGLIYMEENPALKKVYASDNIISTQYLTFGSGNKSNLEILELNSNALNSFTAQNFTKLTSLGLADNPSLNTVTVTNNNALNRLGLKNCPLLSTLKCNNNNLSSVNFSTITGGIELYNSTAITDFDCSHNQLTSLFEYNMSSLLGNLKNLNCSYNQLATLSVSGLSSLESLNCSNNKLNSNGFYSSGCTALSELDCSNNQFSGFDASHLSNLTYLDFSNNQLNNITVSSNSKLQTLKVQYNKLTNLNHPTSIVTLNCDGNSLTGLMFFGRKSLTELSCSLNQIDESHMGSLIYTLPTIPEGSQGILKVIAPGYTYDGVPEANVITDEQLIDARNKRWIPMKYVNGSWVVIPVAIPGDVNGDGEVTAADVTLLYNILLNDNYEGAINPDQSGDGEITSADITYIYNILLGS